MDFRFDFTSIIDRVGMDAMAVESLGPDGIGPDRPKDGFDFIPMWVADMNFATCPSVTEAIIERVKHPLFGYYSPRPNYFQKIIEWQTSRIGHTGLLPEHIGYENGVHGCNSAVVNILTSPGDPILVHRPRYSGFSWDMENQGRVPVYSDLVKDADGIWRMDLDDMERKLRDNNIHLAILSSPHNPCGRVWERRELEQAAALFEKYDCYILSDEIWADLVFSGHKHIPTQMISDWVREHTIAAYALSKTFNLAGMAASYHIIYSKFLRDRMTRYSFNTHYNTQNVLTQHALLGAYTETGSAWVDELNIVLEGNCRFMVDALNSVDGVSVTMPEGTYMLFADLSGYCSRSGRTADEVLKAGWNVGVGWQSGVRFGAPNCVRINTALPNSRVREAARRLLQYVFI